MSTFTIPDISDERLQRLITQVKPVVSAEDEIKGFEEEDLFYEIEIPDLRDVAFTWDPKTKGEAFNFTLVGKAQTYHNWGYYGFFKPSIAEVFAGTDGKIPEDTTHFWLDKDSVQKEGEPLLHCPDERNTGGYHKADVYFLRKRV